MYAVVEFIRANNVKECAHVPVLWLIENNTRCYWPRTKTDEQFRNLVRSIAAHEASWPKYDVHRVLYTGVDYDSAEKYMVNVLENGTSEDGTTTQPVTEKRLTYNDDNDDQETEHFEKNKPIVESQESETSRKERKKQHKRNKAAKKTKRRKRSTSQSSDDTGEYSQDQENESPLANGYQRSLTGLQRGNISVNAEELDIFNNTEFPSRTRPSCSSTHRKDVSITAERRDVSANADIPGNVDTTPQRSIISRNIIGTPRSSQSISNFRSGPGIPEERILKYLEQINHTVDQNQIILGQILRINQTLCQVQNCTKPEGLPEFPISSIDAFEAFDELLKNEEHRLYMMQRLASVGGSSQRQAVMNMLKFLITNNLAMEYNWAGREKRPFKKTNIMKILYEAAKAAFKNKSESSDANIASAVKDWLKLATSRHMYSVTGKKTESV